MVANTTAFSSSIILAFLEVFATEIELSQRLLELTKWINEERPFNTVIFIRHHEEQQEDQKYSYNTDQILKAVMSADTMPVLSFKGNSSYFLWPKFNRRFLALADLKGNLNQDQELLDTLWSTLRRNVLSPLLLLAKKNVSDNYISQILNYCYANKALNVVFVELLPANNMKIYNFQAFPHFEMSSIKLTGSQRIPLFNDKAKDLQGCPLNFVMNKFSNKVFLMQKGNKTSVYGGIGGHFLLEFAHKHNATLRFPNYDEIDEIDITAMEALVANGTYDVSAELFIDLFVNELAYSVIFDYMDWCLMVPLESTLPAYEFYALIFDVTTLVMILVAFILFSLALAATYFAKHESFGYKELLANIYVLNGLLGQSFKAERRFSGTRSFLFMLICLLGLIINTSYVSYLQTFKTTSPKQPAINSWTDVRNSGMRIALYVSEYEMIKPYFHEHELDSFIKIFYSLAEYDNLRAHLDNRYVYPVSTSQWGIFDHQQKRLSAPEFRLTEICFFKMFGMQFPLQTNSSYYEAFNTLITQVNEAGLIYYWKSLAVFEYIMAGRVQLNNTRNADVAVFEPMKLEDMKLLMFLFASMMVLLCTCFVAEIYWPARGKLVKRVVYFIKFLKRYVNK